MKLDEANFLKSDHKVDSKAIQDLLQSLKERSIVYLNGLEAVGKEWAEEAKRDAQNIGEVSLIYTVTRIFGINYY